MNKSVTIKYINGICVIIMSKDIAINICKFGVPPMVICGGCNIDIHELNNVYYIPILNECFCKNCADEFLYSHIAYEEDKDYENRYKDYYINIFKQNNVEIRN